MVLEQLREAGSSAGNQEDIQEWLTTDSNEPGHTTLTEEEILETVTLPDCDDDEEDDDDIADEPPVPSHSEAFTALSTTVRWLEAQDDCDPVSIRLVRRLQQNAAIKRSTKLTRRRITSFFC